jgi:hypothetical protein
MMKTLIASAIGALLLLAIASPSRANDNVSWETIIGIQQASNVVGGITGGGEPWSTLGGAVSVNLTEGTVGFQVRGLVLAGGNSIGTTDKVTDVIGTLVCALTSTTPKVINTPSVPLSPQGNAQFSGSFSSSTTGCIGTQQAFLIRNAANGAWIANGAVILVFP